MYTSVAPRGLLVNVQQLALWGEKEPLFVVFDNFVGVNPPTMAHF